jgi:hypothetical protein
MVRSLFRYLAFGLGSALFGLVWVLRCMSVPEAVPSSSPGTRRFQSGSPPGVRQKSRRSRTTAGSRTGQCGPGWWRATSGPRPFSRFHAEVAAIRDLADQLEPHIRAGARTGVRWRTAAARADRFAVQPRSMAGDAVSRSSVSGCRSWHRPAGLISRSRTCRLRCASRCETCVGVQDQAHPFT